MEMETKESLENLKEWIKKYETKGFRLKNGENMIRLHDNPILDSRTFIDDETGEEKTLEGVSLTITDLDDTRAGEQLFFTASKKIIKAFAEYWANQGTLVDSVFKINKTGSGLKTRYDVFFLPPKNF